MNPEIMRRLRTERQKSRNNASPESQEFGKNASPA